jgi:hypothetical protein
MFKLDAKQPLKLANQVDKYLYNKNNNIRTSIPNLKLSEHARS